MTPLLQDQSNSADDGSPAAYWTPPRLLLALVLVLAGAGIAFFMIQSQLESERVKDLQLAVEDFESAHHLNFDNLQVPAKHIEAGGPPKDGIPALTKPKTIKTKDATFLTDTDRLVAVTIDDQSRAYPIRVLNYHECINDELAGIPIAVIYCPLCDSVSVVSRKLGNQVREFGISGLLLNSNVLLYDRTDQALWTQLGFKAISGPLAGKSLSHLDNWRLTTFGQWRKAKPDSTIVNLKTGYIRNYARNPYRSYFTDDALMFSVSHKRARFKNKTPIIGIKLGDTARAYPIATIKAAPDGRIRDRIGSSFVELRADPKSGSIEIIKSPPDAQVAHTFWFSWVAFHPKTQVYVPKRKDKPSQ